MKLFQDRRGTTYPLRKTDNHMDMEQEDEMELWYNNNKKKKKQKTAEEKFHEIPGRRRGRVPSFP